MKSITYLFPLCFALMLEAVFSQVPLGRVWERVDDRDDVAFNGVCLFAEEVFAVGDGGLIWSSGLNGDWVVAQTYSTPNLLGVAASDNAVVAVGEEGAILIKGEGNEWIEVSSGVSSTLREVVFGGGFFVAVGDNGIALRSADGLEWERWETGTFQSLRALEWNGERFFSLGISLLLTALPDQEVWSNVPLQSGVLGHIRDTLIAGPDRVLIETSWSFIDLEIWEEAAGGSYDLIDGAFGAGVYVGCAANGMLVTTEDGQQWGGGRAGVKGEIVSIDWSGSVFVVVTDCREILTSTDGYRWTRKQLPYNIYSVVELNGKYYTSTGDSVLATSVDGESWTVDIREWRNGEMVSGGGRICMIYAGAVSRVTSDGENWQEVELPAGGGHFNLIWTGEEFLITNSGGGIWSSEDGLVWQLLVVDSIDRVVWDGARYLGHSGQNAVVSEDGENWSFLGIGGGNSVVTMRDMIVMDEGLSLIHI